MPPLPDIDDDLHVILAKSQLSQGTTRPESLVTHTWHVLERLSDQLRLRPELAASVGEPRLWHWLYWGTFLHDFGKAADGFQAMMTGKASRWGYRHEALSLAFVDWLFPDDDADRRYVIAVIACHHRNVEVITSNYQRNRMNPDEDHATRLIAQVQPANIRRLYRWLEQCGQDWAELLGFASHIEIPVLPSLEEALERVTPSAIHRAVTVLDHYTRHLGFADNGPTTLTGTLLRGLIMMADHAGSAHIGEFSPARVSRDAVLKVLRSRPLFAHQKATDEAPAGSVLLISPTSSGKTEAAYLWAARQQLHDGLPAPRLFYLLPYQASMNAAYLRLKEVFTPDAVGLQHSRVAQVLFASALADRIESEAATFAYEQKSLAELLAFAVTVMSPYQLLKVPYQLKGFESLLTNFFGGRFILDEIHAYEPRRLALIIAMVAFLHQHCQARFFIMTATLPPQVREKLHQALPGLHVIEADAATFQQFERHRVHVLDGDLLAAPVIERILADAADQSILIGCNTVKRAAEVYDVLAQRLRDRYPGATDFELILLHSRFNSQDRNHKEASLLKRAGVNSMQRGRTIVVATQVVEVSLNLDLDTIYTEAAPLEALLQRFGRVNRARPRDTPLANVYVVRDQPENVKYVYHPKLISAALECLEEVDGKPIDESRVNDWLARVYAGEALTHWESAYATSWQYFQQEVMASLRPFYTSSLDADFFRMFDSVEVVPMQHLAQFEELIQSGRYLEAANWQVAIAWRHYARLEKLGRAWQDRAGKHQIPVYVVDVPYSLENGLDLDSPTPGDRPGPHGAAPFDEFDVPTEAD